MSDDIGLPVIHKFTTSTGDYKQIAWYVNITKDIARQIVALAGLHYYDEHGRAVAPTPAPVDICPTCRSDFNSFCNDGWHSWFVEHDSTDCGDEYQDATPVDAGGDDAERDCINAMVDAYMSAPDRGEHGGMRGVIAAIRAGKVPGIEATEYWEGVANNARNEVVSIRARLAEIEEAAKRDRRMAEEAHLRAQQYINERDRAMADLADAKDNEDDAVEQLAACRDDLSTTLRWQRGAEADLAAERERRERECHALNNEIEKPAGDAWQAEKDRDAARAEVASFAEDAANALLERDDARTEVAALKTAVIEERERHADTCVDLARICALFGLDIQKHGAVESAINALRAEVASLKNAVIEERERRERECHALNNEIEKHAGDAWQAEKDRDAARAEVAALKSAYRDIADAVAPETQGLSDVIERIRGLRAEVAALKARKVTLPPEVKYAMSASHETWAEAYGFNECRDRCADAIKAAGIEVAE